MSQVLTWSVDYLAGHGSDSPRLDAELLLAHSCGCERIQLYTNYDRILEPQERGRMRDLVQRRAEAVPVAYLIGHREFFGLEFEVDASVLIPRPDTETLVLRAIDVIAERPDSRVIDVGTGSGCIAVALAKHCPDAAFTAVDISAAALAVAKRNADRHEVDWRIEFLQRDLLSGFPSGSFEVIVSNPPYIAEHELPDLDADVRDHEPRTALTSGHDGLELIRELVRTAPEPLTAGGHLLIEVDSQQTQPVQEMMRQTGFQSVDQYNDLSGRPRVVHGALP